MTRIQFGWAMPAGARPKTNRSRYVSDLHHGLNIIKGRFDSAWIVDHLQIDDNDLMEGWTALTYMAAQHPELKFGHAVLAQSFRNPALLAKMAATLQFVSGGRYILGLGCGWKEDEYLAYGYDFPPAIVRVEQLDEYVQIIRRMWQDERATFEGKYYRVTEAWCEPKPDPLPTIMIGAMKPKMISLAVRHADWWNVSWTNIDDFRPMLEHFERACEEQGRDPGTIRRTWFGGCACAPTQEALDKLMEGKPLNPNGIMGTTEQVIDQMRAFIDLGVDYFMLGTPGIPNFTTLETLLNDVLPAIQGDA